MIRLRSFLWQGFCHFVEVNQYFCSYPCAGMPGTIISHTKQDNYRAIVGSYLAQNLLPPHQSKGLGEVLALQVGVSV